MATQLWIKAQAKKCPKCSAPVMMNGGCNWIDCQACRHGFCWLCMGGDDLHPTPQGWPHPKQCDSMNDVIKLGRVDKMYDES